jgi:hypothetical protein
LSSTPNAPTSFALLTPEDVDLIDIGEVPSGRRMTQPFAQVGAGASEMRGHLVTFGNEVDDLHPEVRERFPEWPDPLPRSQRDLAIGYFVQHLKVAPIDRIFNQTADQELVLFSAHAFPASASPCWPDSAATV